MVRIVDEKQIWAIPHAFLTAISLHYTFAVGVDVLEIFWSGSDLSHKPNKCKLPQQVMPVAVTGFRIRTSVQNRFDNVATISELKDSDLWSSIFFFYSEWEGVWAFCRVFHR